MTSVDIPSWPVDEADRPTAAQRASALRRAFFATSQLHARWRVDVDEVVERSGCARQRWKNPQSWIEDLVVACACIRGEQEAWHHVMLANTRALRECGEQVRSIAGLSPRQSASLEVERFWRDLREATRSGCRAPRLQEYRGDETLGSWLQGKYYARIDSGTLSRRGLAVLDSAAQTRTLGLDAVGIRRQPTAT